MENAQQLSAKFDHDKYKNKKNEMHYDLEAHSLSLRKKANNKVKKFVLPNSLANDLSYEIDLSEIVSKINEHQLYAQFKTSTNETNSLGLLFQMLLIENNDNILKFSLANIKTFLINTDENSFQVKNLSSEFNDKLVKYLFELLFKKSNDFYILSNICFILNKLSTLISNEQEYYFNILFDNLGNILNLAKSIRQEDPQIKNLLYLLSSKIFLASDEIISKLEKTFPYYIVQIYQELINLDESKFVRNMLLISTLLNLINNCFFYKIYSDYFFSTSTNDINGINVENILNFIKKLLNFSYQMEILEQELRCVQNFLYLFLEEEKYFNDTNLRKKVQKIINALELEKKVIPLIYDGSINQPSLRIVALHILVNSTFICTKKFCEKLINNDISEQIIKLENYLIEQIQITNRTKNLYKLLMDLIYNLIENESVEIIDNLSIESNCISLLFKLQKIPLYSKENQSYMVKIFNTLIQSNHKYIQTLLISEGICEWYKEILIDAPNKEIIEMIITNFLTMVKYSANLVKDDNNKNNLLLIHLEKIGILEIVNNFKSRNDFSNEFMGMINEFTHLFK